MTQQRLAQLLAEFEAARDAMNTDLFRLTRWYCKRIGGNPNQPDWWAYLSEHDIDRFCALNVRPAARRYIIARDFNEFDPDRADMLWKLANGGAQ